MSSHSFESENSQSQEKSSSSFRTIETGHVVFNRQGQILEMTGDLDGNKRVVDTLVAIVNALKLHAQSNVNNEKFLALTIQFSDHYYKIDITQEDVIVHRFLLLNNADVIV